MATEQILELTETIENLVIDKRQLQTKCIELKVRVDDLDVAAVAATTFDQI